jgi:hypothetical protein
VFVVDARWKGVRECLVDQTEVGVAAVPVPAGECWRRTQVLRAATAESATAVSAAEPGHADPITDLKPARVLSERIDETHDLMARGDVGALRRQVCLSQMQIGSADPAAGDPHPELPVRWLRHLAFQPQQRSGVDLTRLMHHPGPHLAILSSRPPGREPALPVICSAKDNVW